jgi:multisubunit Na+/H+ antiporter MnhG subunit
MSIAAFDNVYFLTLFYVIVGSFVLSILLGLIGIVRMNLTTYSKCPKCSGRIANGAVICKTCGVNINSMEDPAIEYKISRLRRFKDYLDNLHPNQMRNVTSLSFFLLLLFVMIFAWVKY